MATAWRNVPKQAGLNRCGKSCRRRWTNYLRPDINLRPFTDDEEKTIIRLHSIYGNKWSAIASQLPGRTDNFIKNYWNTNLRKKLPHKCIDPVMHSLPTELSFLTGLAGHPAVAAGSSLSSLSMAPSASNMDASQPHTDVFSFVRDGSDMNTLRFNDEATSFTNSYSNMKPPRFKGEATSFTGSYSDMKPPRIKGKATSFTGSYADTKPPRIKVTITPSVRSQAVWMRFLKENHRCLGNHPMCLSNK